jgi:hypothetical protein
MDNLMIEKPLIPSSDRPYFLCENPCERALPDQPLCEQQDASSKLIKTPEHEQIVFPNPTNKKPTTKPTQTVKEKSRNRVS